MNQRLRKADFKPDENSDGLKDWGHNSLQDFGPLHDKVAGQAKHIGTWLRATPGAGSKGRFASHHYEAADADTAKNLAQHIHANAPEGWKPMGLGHGGASAGASFKDGQGNFHDFHIAVGHSVARSPHYITSSDNGGKRQYSYQMKGEYAEVGKGGSLFEATSLFKLAVLKKAGAPGFVKPKPVFQAGDWVTFRKDKYPTLHGGAYRVSAPIWDKESQEHTHSLSKYNDKGRFVFAHADRHSSRDLMPLEPEQIPQREVFKAVGDNDAWGSHGGAPPTEPQTIHPFIAAQLEKLGAQHVRTKNLGPDALGTHQYLHEFTHEHPVVAAKIACGRAQQHDQGLLQNKATRNGSLNHGFLAESASGEEHGFEDPARPGVGAFNTEHFIYPNGAPGPDDDQPGVHNFDVAAHQFRIKPPGGQS